MTLPVLKMSQVLLRVFKDLADGYDVVIEIDANDANRHGPVGTGKTTVGWWAANRICAQLNDWDIRLGCAAKQSIVTLPSGTEVLIPGPGCFFVIAVIKDNLAAWKDALLLNRFGKIVFVPEFEDFAHSEFHGYKEVKATNLQFNNNRKEGGIYILNSPLIGKLVDFLRESRIQQRWRVEKRGLMTIFDRAGLTSVDLKHDKWGRAVALMPFPPPPPRYWESFAALEYSHECDDRCTSNLDSRSWGVS